MDTLPSSLRPLFDQAESLIAWLIARAAEVIYAETVRTRFFAIFISTNYLRPAETALRRLICLIAAHLAAEPSRPAVPGRGLASGLHAAAPRPTLQQARAPLFCLTEPLPRLAGPCSAAQETGPRLRSFDDPDPPPPPPRSPADPSACGRNLVRRFEALKAAFADPVRAARRLKRLQQRLAPERPNLSLCNVPGREAVILNLFPGAHETFESLNRAVACIPTAYHDSG